MSSAAEAEIGALYLNAREAVYLRQILVEMGHPQPPTPIQTDNTTAEGVVNHKIQPKRTKATRPRTAATISNLLETGGGRTWRIIGQNIMHQPTTQKYEQNS